MGQIKNIKLHIVTDIKVASRMHLRRVLGCMSFGGAFNEAQSHQLLKQWVKAGYCETDNAIMYSGGKAEKIQGRLHLSRDPEKMKIACKANLGLGFTKDDIIKQLDTSLQSLSIPSCDIFYLHWPDHTVPIEDTLKGVDQLHKDGKFKEFGLSNYASWEVADIYHICKQSGYVLPTVYQGMYNALTRDIELELIPCLRRYGIRFYVYNPLAAGMLTGKYDFSKNNEEQPKGRFFVEKENAFTAKWAKAYQDRYWRDNYKHGVQHVIEVLEKTIVVTKTVKAPVVHHKTHKTAHKAHTVVHKVTKPVKKVVKTVKHAAKKATKKVKKVLQHLFHKKKTHPKTVVTKKVVTKTTIVKKPVVTVQKPVVHKTIVHKPVVHKPVVKKPVVTVHKTIVHKPVVTKKVVTKTTIVKKPVVPVHKPVVHKPVVHKPVVHKPVVTVHKTIVHKPVVHKPVHKVVTHKKTVVVKPAPHVTAKKIITHHKTVVVPAVHKKVAPVHHTTVHHKTTAHKTHHKAVHHATTHHKTVHHKIVHPKVIHPKVVIPHHPKPVHHAKPVHHGHHHTAAAKPQTHLAIIFRTLIHAIKGTVAKVTTPVTHLLTPVTHLTRKVVHLTTKLTTRTTTKAIAIVRPIHTKIITILRPITGRTLAIVRPIHAKVVAITRPVVKKVVAITTPLITKVTALTTRVRTCALVDCLKLPTWTARMKCLWTMECNLIHKIIKIFHF